MSAPFKVLWLSRHALGAEQIADLAEDLDRPADQIEVVAINATYPACSVQAVQYLAALAVEHGIDLSTGCIAAVLPGHIAARVERSRHPGEECSLPLDVWLPVSVPAAAAHGEARGGGFTHSHWECV